MNIKPWFNTFAVVAALVGCPWLKAETAVAGGAAEMPPNVLFIIADDAEMQDFGCYGGRLATPHIDRIAREGVRFTRAYPAASVCTPSRCSILTGCYPSTAASVARRTPAGEPASIRWKTFIAEDDPAIGKAFQNQGFQAGFVGKWHIGEPEQLSTSRRVPGREIWTTSSRSPRTR
ncbi:MAG: sulfatase-like hydrolase/transferase [Planctomycetota bacterium]